MKNVLIYILILFTATQLFGREKIVIGMESDNYPFEFIDQNDNITGLSLELFELIAKDNNWEVEYVINSRAILEDLLSNNKIDLLLTSKNINRTDSTMLFSQQYFLDELDLFINMSTRKITNIAELAGKRIIINQNEDSYLYLANSEVKSTIFPVEKSDDALLLLANGGYDGALLNRSKAEFEIKKEHLNELIQTKLISDSIPISFVLNKSQQKELIKINQSLDQLIKKGKVTDLINRWQNYKPQKNEQWLFDWFTMVILVGIILLLTLLFALWSFHFFKYHYNKFVTTLTVILVFLGFFSAAFIAYQTEKREILNSFYQDLEIETIGRIKKILEWRYNSDISRLILPNPRFLYRAKLAISTPSDSTNNQLLKIWTNSFADFAGYDEVTLYNQQLSPILKWPINEKLDFITNKNDSLYSLKSHEKAKALLSLRENSVNYSDIIRLEQDSLSISLFVPFKDSVTQGIFQFKRDPNQHLIPMIKNYFSEQKNITSLVYYTTKDSVFTLNEFLQPNNSKFSGYSLIKDKQLPIVEAALGRKGRFRGVNCSGEHILIFAKPIPRSNWGIFSTIDEKFYEDKIVSIKWLITLFFVFLITITLLVLHYATWQLKRKHLKQELNDQRLINLMSENLSDAETKYHKLFDSMPVGCALHEMIVDQNGKAIDYRFLDFNPMFETLTGLKSSETINKTIKEIFPPSEHKFVDFYAPVALEGQVLYFEEFSPNINKHFEIYAYSPQYPLFVTMFNDITIRKEAEEKIKNINIELESMVNEKTADLLSANRELESFSYSVSHDLRAPLRAIEGFATALYEDYNETIDGVGQDYLKRVKDAANHMSELIDDFLKLSRISRQETSIETIDLTTLFYELSDQFKSVESTREFEFIADKDCSVEGDMNLTRILFTQFMTNSIKFTKNRPIALIELRKVVYKDKEFFCFKDNGAGFDATYQNKLFIPFQRLHSEKDFPGTGIGLAIAQRIVAKHGGEIFGEGEIDQGANFFFRW